MPRKKYIISLSPEERSDLEQFSRTGKAAAYAMTHARILLKADVAHPDGGWNDSEISAALDVSVATLEVVDSISHETVRQTQRLLHFCFTQGVDLRKLLLCNRSTLAHPLLPLNVH